MDSALLFLLFLSDVKCSRNVRRCERSLPREDKCEKAGKASLTAGLRKHCRSLKPLGAILARPANPVAYPCSKEARSQINLRVAIAGNELRAVSPRPNRHVYRARETSSSQMHREGASPGGVCGCTLQIVWDEGGAKGS